MKFPKCKMPQLFSKREDSGKTEFVGLTSTEWASSTGALCMLYLVLAAFFAALLSIAQAIRNNGDTYIVPGTEQLDED